MAIILPRRRARRRGLVSALLLAVATAVVLAVAGCFGSPSTPPTTAGGTQTSFLTSDGLKLSGREFGEGPKGVVLAHMFPADQTSWFGLAPKLAREGYHVLTFDFRGYGDSAGEKEISKLDRDVVAAVDELQRRGAEDVVLVGASMGGTASLIAGTQRPCLGVICLSAPVEFRGLDARSAVTKLRVPLLFIYAEGDSAADAIETFATLARRQLQTEAYEGDEHGTELLEGEHRTQVENRILDFLSVAFAG